MKKILPSEITPEYIYQNRRSFIKSAAAGTASLMLGSFFSLSASSNTLTSEKLTSYKDITTYNNYYEFGTDKEDPSNNSGKFKISPWSVTIEGEVEQAKTFSYEQIVKNFPSEERIYRLRCVEGWSMVIPWMGFSLSNLLKTVSPTSKAKFVEFISVYRPEEMIGQQSKILDWPYREGLRLDEAMHPLTIMATGLYGKNLPNQNGAPIRLVVPWKYGFKSAKAIVKIRLVENIPISSWMNASPAEYGFYSNVNPNVDHPRWSQATERRIGDSFFDPRRPTEMFNGYANEVSNLYKGMDLRKYY
jgi:sulfoxide reductase catalytic subunit YedY